MADAESNRGKVHLVLEVDVDDAAALVDAGKRSVARDAPTDWEFGQPSPAADDPDEIIDTPAQALVDLLMEGLVRCFDPLTSAGHQGALIDKVHGITDLEWADKTWTPHADNKEHTNG